MPQLRRNAIAGVLLIFVIGFLAGCKNSERAWSEQSKSPDGKLIATAETLEPGGWGTGAPPETYVNLNWTSGSQNPTVVFSFNDGPNEPGGMKVGMHWLTPRHLELTYKGNPTIDFQAIKWTEVEISARPESGSSSASSSTVP
jgi:hypothetical protein